MRRKDKNEMKIAVIVLVIEENVRAAARCSGLGVSLLARVYPPEGRWTDRA